MKNPFTVDLSEEMQRTATSGEGLVKEAQQLLLTVGEEEDKLLRAAGLDFQRRKAEALIGSEISRKKAAIGADVLPMTSDEVKALCIKYGMRVRPAREYQGYVDPAVGPALARFVKAGNFPSTEHSLRENSFVMAPTEMFRRADPVAKTDPVFLYRIIGSNGEHYFQPVHRWGNDMTVLRELFVVPTRDAVTHMWFTFLMTIMIGVLMCLSLAIQGPKALWMVIPALAAFLVWRIGRQRWIDNHTDDHRCFNAAWNEPPVRAAWYDRF